MQFLRLPQVRDKVGLSRSQIYRLIQLGRFPAPHKIGAASVWTEEAVEDWQRKQLVESQATR